MRKNKRGLENLTKIMENIGSAWRRRDRGLATMAERKEESSSKEKEKRKEKEEKDKAKAVERVQREDATNARATTTPETAQLEPRGKVMEKGKALKT